MGIFDQNTLRWYLTPVVMSKFDSQTPNTCWRLCHAKGDILNILWSCLKLTTYWAKMFTIISDLTQVTPDPALALLSLGIDKFPANLWRSITLLFLAARLSITRKWKDSNPPSPNDAIDLTKLHNMYEKILASSLGSLHTYTIHWAPWNLWYDNLAWFTSLYLFHLFVYRIVTTHWRGGHLPDTTSPLGGVREDWVLQFTVVVAILNWLYNSLGVFLSYMCECLLCSFYLPGTLSMYSQMYTISPHV